jgi:hypothetical protein
MDSLARVYLTTHGSRSLPGSLYSEWPVTVSSSYSTPSNGSVHQCIFCFGVGYTKLSVLSHQTSLGSNLRAFDCAPTQASSQPSVPTGSSPHHAGHTRDFSAGLGAERLAHYALRAMQIKGRRAENSCSPRVCKPSKKTISLVLERRLEPYRSFA